MLMRHQSTRTADCCCYCWLNFLAISGWASSALRNYVKHTKTEVTTKGFRGFGVSVFGASGKNTQTVRVIPLDFRKGYWPHRAKKWPGSKPALEGGKPATASTKEMNCSVAKSLPPASPSSLCRLQSSAFLLLTQWSINRLSTIQMQTIDYSDKAEEPFVSDSSSRSSLARL